MENLSRLHLKKSKKTMSKTKLRKRAVVRAMAKVINANGRAVARGFDVTPSHMSACVDGKAVDRDGNVVDNW